MLEKRPLLYNPSPILQLILFFAIIVISLLISLFLGLLIGLPFFGIEMVGNLAGGADVGIADNLNILKYLQIVNQLGVFVFPALAFAFLVNRNVPEYLSLDRRPKLFPILAGISLIFMVLPFLHFLAEINEMIRLPGFLSGFEQWMKDSEVRATELTEAFINVKTYPGFILNILMIAILPAIGEEFLFRGVLLRIFRDLFRNVHIAIIVSAILFSALHLQFYGFLPRFFLGVALGYIFIWSGSLWLPIIIHFFNNALAVVVIFYLNLSGRNTSIDEIGSSQNYFVIVLSAVLVILLMLFIYSYEKKQSQA